MVDPHPGTEEDLMCIGLSLFEVGHFDETGSHYSLVPFMLHQLLVVIHAQREKKLQYILTTNFHFF